ncbi:MAG: hypothetical protein WDM85_17810 [Caulobacteraceae bacterium]
MGKWLAIAAVFSAADGKTRGRARIVPPPTILLRTRRCRRPYAVKPPASHGYIPDGWAMRATFKGPGDGPAVARLGPGPARAAERRRGPATAGATAAPPP